MAKRGPKPHPDILTPRQWEVLDFVRRGLSDQQIADSLGISLDGAKYHVSEILSKLGVATREEAVAWVAGERRRLRLRWVVWPLAAMVSVSSALTLAFLSWGVLETDLGTGDAAADWVRVADTDDLKVRQPLTVQEREVHLVRLDSGEILALWDKDPHLGCRVPWDPWFSFMGRTGWFRNPCHAETYDLTGACFFGPCPRGLDRFPVMTLGEDVFVDFGTVIEGPPLSQAASTPLTPERTPGGPTPSPTPALVSGDDAFAMLKATQEIFQRYGFDSAQAEIMTVQDSFGLPEFAGVKLVISVPADTPVWLVIFDGLTPIPGASAPAGAVGAPAPPCQRLLAIVNAETGENILSVAQPNDCV